MEHLTIEKAKNKIEKLNNELNVYLEKKQLNFLKTQPKATQLKDAVVNSNFINDKFVHYVIKDEDLDDNIYCIQKEINSLEAYIIKEMERISKNSKSDLIRYYRDIAKYRWEKIAQLTNYSVRQCQRLYNTEE